MKWLLALVLCISAQAQTVVCQKFSKQGHTFIQMPCPISNHPKWQAFRQKIARDTRETLIVSGTAALGAGILYLKASEPSFGGSNTVNINFNARK